MQYIKTLTHRLFRILGYDFLKYNADNFVALRRAQMLKSQAVDLLLDIGANEGTYPLALRDTGYRGQIISFEPLPESYSILHKRVITDPRWTCENVAIGDFDGIIELNVSRHKTSSSVLPMTHRHIDAAPSSEYIDIQKAKVARLDSFSHQFENYNSLWLKIDVQGYEKHVLQGAVDTLKRARALEMELSLVPLYEGGTLMNEMLDLLSQLGFTLVSLEPVFFRPETNELLQADGIFIRK